jgi:hypothetical protein
MSNVCGTVTSLSTISQPVSAETPSLFKLSHTALLKRAHIKVILPVRVTTFSKCRRPNSSSGQLDEATAGGSSEDLKDGRANHNKNEEAENHRTDRVAAGLLSSRFGYLPSLEDVLLELGTFVISQSL